MKNTYVYVSIFILSFIQSFHAQSKVENFYNYDFQKISKAEFKKISYQKGYTYNQFELEDQIANILYQPQTKGRLTPEEYSSLKKQLNKISPLEGKYIIVIYYPGKDKCNQKSANSKWNIFDKDFKRKVNRLTTNNIFWIYKNDEDLKYYYPQKINWQKDENEFIEKLFFKMHYPCASSTIIDERGNYISNLGEFGKQDVIENIKELTSSSVNNKLQSTK